MSNEEFLQLLIRDSFLYEKFKDAVKGINFSEISIKNEPVAYFFVKSD